MIKMNQVIRKDGITYQRNKPRTKETIPSKAQYIQTLNRLSTASSFDCYMVLRLGCEMGLSRQDIVNLKVPNIDKYHERGLWIEISKTINIGSKKNPNWKMRTREVPINQNLYVHLMTSIDKNFIYVLKKQRGDVNKPYTVQRIDELYKENQIPWSPHKSRHLFKVFVWDWMRANRQVDPPLMKELMGHKKTVDEEYGSISWDYKLEVIDKVFS